MIQRTLIHVLGDLSCRTVNYEDIISCLDRREPVCCSEMKGVSTGKISREILLIFKLISRRNEKTHVSVLSLPTDLLLEFNFRN